MIKKHAHIITIVAVLFIIVGIFVFCFPYINNLFYEKDVETRKEDFIEQISDENNKTKLDELYQELQRRNQELFESNQANLVDPFSYEQPTIDLSQYGIINGMVMPIILFPSTFLNSFSGLLIPEFSSFNIRNENIRIKKSIEKIFKYTMFFSFFVVGFFYCFSDNLSVIIYKNIELSKYIKILAPIIIFMYLDNIVDGILKGLDKQVAVMIINIIDLISSIILICILLPLYGIAGYLIVLFISEILNASLSIFILLHSVKIRFDYKKLLLRPILVLLFSIILTNIFKFETYSIFFLVLDGLVFAVFYFLFSFLFNFISKEDLKL